LSGARPGAKYKAEWFNPRMGQWADARMLNADAEGRMTLPVFPGGAENSDEDWGLKLTVVAQP
ncbi:MAG: hypothetical protein IMZ55_20000, partial [Acidobacteria bacterium]|nr:hypothetical protein [Acidobacteriota bacterium]